MIQHIIRKSGLWHFSGTLWVCMHLAITRALWNSQHRRSSLHHFFVLRYLSTRPSCLSRPFSVCVFMEICGCYEMIYTDTHVRYGILSLSPRWQEHQQVAGRLAKAASHRKTHKYTRPRSSRSAKYDLEDNKAW